MKMLALGAGKIAQRIRAHIAITAYLNVVHSTYVEWLTMPLTAPLGELMILCDLCRHLYSYAHTPTQTHANTQFFKKN